MKPARFTPPVFLSLSGAETRISVLFCARGAYRRGGMAPCPLFECQWNDGTNLFTLKHNTTNQIKAAVGQINLDTTSYNDIGTWRHYRIILEKIVPAQMLTTLFIDGTFVWKNASPGVMCGEKTSAPAFSFVHPGENGRDRAAFAYLMVVIDRDIETVPLAVLAAEEGIDINEKPPVDEAFFACEPLPPIPMAPTWTGDQHPFYTFPDGAKGLNPDSLPFSGSSVRKVIRQSVPNSEKYDMIVDPASADGCAVFATIPEAIAALPPRGGTVLVRPGIYTGAFRVTGSDITLRGENPFTTIITGYEALGNGIGKNILVRYAATRDGSGAKNGTFRAENLTFYNRGAEWNASIGHDERRGAALGVEAIANGAFTNCLFLGQQDTLYLKSGTLRFTNCYIEGDVDYICGGATALFSDCHLHTLKYRECYITAAAPVNECRPPDAQGVAIAGFDLKGFIFYHCLLTMDSAQDGPIYLGRGPWINGSGLPDDRKNSIRSSVTWIECAADSGDRPFFLGETAHWRSMDKDCSEELYREYRNSF